jgi:hypothetical protein
MSTSQQRWLSIDGICDTLTMSRSLIKSLVKSGALVSIGSGPNTRYLDPTEEYANKLRLGEALYERLYPIPKDLNLAALLTIREVAAITGWKWRYACLVLEKVPHIKVGRYNMYSVQTVRDLLWRRQGRKQAHQKSCFLVEDLIRFFFRYYESENAEVPSDAAFANDAVLKSKLARILKMHSPAKEEALRSLWQAVEMAKQAAAILRS